MSDPDPVPAFGQAERFVDGVRLTIGSSSAITACGAARLGLAVAMVGVVGDDALGRFMLDALAERGVDVSACRVATGRRDRRVRDPQQRHRPRDPDRDRDDRRRPGGGRARGAAGARPARPRRQLLPAARARGRAPGACSGRPAPAGATTSLDPNWDPSGAWDGGFAAAAAEADVAAAQRRGGRAADGDRRRRGGRPLAGVAIGRAADGRRQVRRRRRARDRPGRRRGAGRGDRAWRPSTRSAPATRSTPGSSRRGSTACRWRRRSGWAVACGSLSTRAAGGTDGQPTREEAEAALRAVGMAR